MDANKKGMTATEQKELRRVFNHLANFLPKQSIYAELNPLVERSSQLTHFLKNPEVLKVHDLDGNEMRSDDVVREQADLQLKIDELRKRIQDYDNSPTSKIHAADLNEAMRMLGRKCTKKEIEDMVWEVDENLDGCVDWEEFKVSEVMESMFLWGSVVWFVWFFVSLTFVIVVLFFAWTTTIHLLCSSCFNAILQIQQGWNHFNCLMWYNL